MCRYRGTCLSHFFNIKASCLSLIILIHLTPLVTDDNAINYNEHLDSMMLDTRGHDVSRLRSLRGFDIGKSTLV